MKFQVLPVEADIPPGFVLASPSDLKESDEENWLPLLEEHKLSSLHDQYVVTLDGQVTKDPSVFSLSKEDYEKLGNNMFAIVQTKVIVSKKGWKEEVISEPAPHIDNYEAESPKADANETEEIIEVRVVEEKNLPVKVNEPEKFKKEKVEKEKIIPLNDVKKKHEKKKEVLSVQPIEEKRIQPNRPTTPNLMVHTPTHSICEIPQIQTVPEKVDQASSPPEYASVWDSLRDPYYDQKQVKKFITKFSGMFRKNKVDRAKIPVTKNI
jgi:hypothetical protein